MKQKMQNKPKSRKPKLDPDVAIMENLYANDGALPQQYTAWTPPAADAKAAPPPAVNFDLDSFLQVASTSTSKLSTRVSDLINSAAFAAQSFLEEFTVHTDALHISAANAVLEHYAQVLQSPSLKQLAKAKLSPQKLAALWGRLQAVDPLTHPTLPSSQGKQAQAEQWCLYFQRNEQSATPMHKAIAQLEDDSNAFAEATSQRAALAEEINARTQLQKTVEQDVRSLTALLTQVQWQENATGQEAAQAKTRLKAEQRAPSSLLDLGAATDGLREGNEELADALQAVLQQRVQVLQTQRSKLTQLQGEVKKLDKGLAAKKDRVSKSKASLDAARKRLTGIRSSCSTALSTLAKRRHMGHMEAHAIEMALKVLGASASGR